MTLVPFHQEDAKTISVQFGVNPITEAKSVLWDGRIDISAMHFRGGNCISGDTVTSPIIYGLRPRGNYVLAVTAFSGEQSFSEYIPIAVM